MDKEVCLLAEYLQTYARMTSMTMFDRCSDTRTHVPGGTSAGICIVGHVLVHLSKATRTARIDAVLTGVIGLVRLVTLW